MHPLSRRFLFSVTLTAIAVALGAFSTADAKQKPGQRARPAPPQAKADSPAEKLAPFIEHLDLLLALERPDNPKAAARINGAGGRVAVLKQEFVAKRATAEGADKAQLEAAIQTCDALTNAIDEREKTLSQIRASDAVKNSSKLGERRKENISAGVEGRGNAKAVGTIVEARREQAEKREAQRIAANDHNAITAAAVNRWNQRAVELRKDINARYARIGTAASP
jgi:hypothetical protein